MHKSATKCNETLGKWCKNKHGASKIIDTLETYQRCTIRWIKQGEDNTKFFHAMATKRFRRNDIAMLQDCEGNEVTDHDLMAGMLWNEYKDRMGKLEGIEM
jgi:hypothetical protein